MGKKIGGWLLLMVAGCGFILGLLILIGGLTGSGRGFRTLLDGVIVMLVSFSFARLGWKLRAPVLGDNLGTNAAP